MLITNRLLAFLFLAIGIMACTPNNAFFSSNSHNTKSKQNINVIDLRSKTTLETIIPSLTHRQVVLVGESHTSLAHHHNQLAVIKALHPYWPKMGVGLEFIQSTFQQPLDDYVAGSINEAEMLKRTEWYKRWKYDFRLYRDIFRYAKTNKIPLIALNAPAELTKKIRKSGIDGLTASERNKLPKTILRDPSYRERMLKVFRQHGSLEPKQLDNFIDVQLAWDESMAANAAQAINSGKVKNMVLLAGAGHVIRQAIPVRLERYLSSKPVIIANAMPEEAGQVDFVLSAKAIELPAAGKIGIMMTDSDTGVRVNEVLKTHLSDLKKDDLILGIDHQQVDGPEDVKIILLDKKPGQTIQVKIQRKHQAKTITRSIKLH